MYVNAKMIPAETTPGIRVEGISYIVRTHVKATMYSHPEQQ
jgi:hypothetical protein